MSDAIGKQTVVAVVTVIGVFVVAIMLGSATLYIAFRVCKCYHKRKENKALEAIFGTEETPTPMDEQEKKEEMEFIRGDGAFT